MKQVHLLDEEIKTSAFRYDSMKAAEGKRMFSFVYAKELSPNNFPYSLSFSPRALPKNQLHSPLCA